MDSQRLLGELLDFGERAGMEIRQVYLGGEGGGLCVVRGKRVLFVDSGASLADQLARTAAALASVEDLEKRYLLPEVRQVLEKYRDEA